MKAPRNSAQVQNLPGIQEMRAYRSASTDAAFITGIGAAIGNFAAGTVAGALLHSPTWFGTPFLPASFIGTPIYSLVPVIITGIQHSAAPGAMTAIYAAAGTFAACTAPLGILGLRKAAKTRAKILKSDVHGSAHFADRKEIEAAGLLPAKKKKTRLLPWKKTQRVDKKHICYVGGWTDPKTEQQVYLQHSGPEHIIVHAPTRSGKGVGLVIPTLLSWQGSVLVHDIKGENHAITAGWRASIGQRVLRFAPTDPDHSCHFNPLDEIRIGTPHEVKDVQNIATMIVDPDGKGLNDHWAKTGFALLVGTILHVLYCDEIKQKTLAAVGALLSNPDVDPEKGVDEIFESMKQYPHDPSRKHNWRDHNGNPTNTHPAVAQSAQEMLNKAPNEKSGVISTAMSFLSLYRDPQVAETISRSDFSIPDLMHADKPISLYLVVPPSDKDRLKPLIRLILNQVVRRLTEKMEFENGRSVAKYKHRLLLMIDEFPSLGKLDVFAEALAFIAGYGLKAYLICQDTVQLEHAYTTTESITSNCHIRIYYAPNKIQTAKHVSEQLGKRTLVTESHNVSYAGGSVMPYQTGMSGGIQYQGRELLTPDEVMRLRGPEKDADGNIVQPGDMLVVSAGHAPVMGTQILYFRDPVFDRRSKISSPDLGDTGSRPVAITPPATSAPAQLHVSETSIQSRPETAKVKIIETINTDEISLDDGLPPEFDDQNSGNSNDFEAETAEITPETEDPENPVVDDDSGMPPNELIDPAPAEALDDLGQPGGDQEIREILTSAAVEARSILAARVLGNAVAESGDTFRPDETAEQRKADKAAFAGLF